MLPIGSGRLGLCRPRFRKDEIEDLKSFLFVIRFFFRKGENLMVPMRAAKKLTEFLDLPQDRLSHTVMEQFAHGSAK